MDGAEQAVQEVVHHPLGGSAAGAGVERQADHPVQLGAPQQGDLLPKPGEARRRRRVEEFPCVGSKVTKVLATPSSLALAQAWAKSI